MAVGIGGYGLIDDNKEAKRIGLEVAEAGAYSTLIVQVLKFAFGRSRPYTGRGHNEFSPFKFSDDYNALPSGHTIFAFAIGSTMAMQYDNLFWKIGWYTLATLVGTARIYHNMHWFSDTMLGAAMGYFLADFIHNHYTNFNLSRGINETNGVSLSFKFGI